MAKITATVVLVHGAWADGSSWNKVIPLLQAKGLTVLAVQLPLTSIDDDLAVTKRRISTIEGPIVLVGHSWGGMAITQAGVDPKVAALVYLSAFAPDIGESGSALIGAHPAPPALSTVATDSAGFTYQTVEGMVSNVAPDVPEADAKILAVTQGRLAAAAFGQTAAAAAWKTRPTWFILTPEDRVVNIELQRAESERMKARVTVLRASHMSLLSQPAEVAAVIEEAVLTAVATTAHSN
jgi:pimeloyl-ACP methyl ester carboxylesterase